MSARMTHGPSHAMSEAFLGIDLGTSSVKALVVDPDGTVRGTGSAEYPVLRPQPGWAEQDPDTWWEATSTAVQQAIGWSGSGVSIGGVGFSGQMHGAVFLGENERVLSPAVIWADQRSSRQASEVTEKIGAKRLIEIAGSPLVTGFMAATAAWMREERASVWWRTKRLLSPKDEIRRRMTGATATDPATARRHCSSMRAGATGPRPTRRGRDSQHLAAARETVECCCWRDHTGYRRGTRSRVGNTSGHRNGGRPKRTTRRGHRRSSDDAPLAQHRCPGHGAGRCFHPDLAGRTPPCSALEPGPGCPGWYQMGATLVAGMALRWLRDEMLQLPAAGAYERMTSWAAKAPLGARGLLFLPYLVGERSPHMDPRARGAFLGLAAHHDHGDVVRAVMEGITFACRDAFAALQDAGASPERIVMAGGGSRSPFWRQMVADMFGLPVYALATTDQAAMGAALLAASGIRELDPVETAHRWARYGPATEPNLALNARYEELYELFRDAYTPVIGVSHRLGDWFQASVGPRVVPRPIRKRG